mmetsp:Transcript_3703/g.8594  ORF Transcript_3703/g.8594 Transcript_3703/m.8594 type:complete len:323 (-) Transcript_3703:88-1056(-)
MSATPLTSTQGRSHSAGVGEPSCNRATELGKLLWVVEVREEEGAEVGQQEEVSNMATSGQRERAPHLRSVCQVFNAVEEHQKGKKACGPRLAVSKFCVVGLAAALPPSHPHSRQECEDLNVVRPCVEDILNELAPGPLVCKPEFTKQRNFKEREHGTEKRKTPDILVLNGVRERGTEPEDPGQHHTSRGEGHDVAIEVARVDVWEDEAEQTQAEETHVHQHHLGAEVGKEPDRINTGQDAPFQQGKGHHGCQDLHKEVPDGVAARVVVSEMLVHDEAAPQEQQTTREHDAVAVMQHALHAQQDVPLLASQDRCGIGLELHGC